MESHVVLGTRLQAGCSIHRTGRTTVGSDNRLALARGMSLSEMNTPSPGNPVNWMNEKSSQAVHLPSASRFPPKRVSKLMLHSPRTISPPLPREQTLPSFLLSPDRCHLSVHV